MTVVPVVTLILSKRPRIRNFPTIRGRFRFCDVHFYAEAKTRGINEGLAGQRNFDKVPRLPKRYPSMDGAMHRIGFGMETNGWTRR